MLVLDVTSPDLPTARLEHKAHLTLNDFDKIVLQEVRAGWWASKACTHRTAGAASAAGAIAAACCSGCQSISRPISQWGHKQKLLSACILDMCVMSTGKPGMAG